VLRCGVTCRCATHDHYDPATTHHNYNDDPATAHHNYNYDGTTARVQRGNG
jgi:hypothetical protein